ncbi:MAG: PTS sugar transporter subunit IIB [Chloroflexi bacterium]|nr:PTS sugar transporter subunit IIB [Chloroflexota bacterium]
MKTVYVVCATGIATSTMLRLKVESFLEERGIEARVLQFRVTELSPERVEADVILATTEIPPEFEGLATVINGISLITGIGQGETLESLARALRDDS